MESNPNNAWEHFNQAEIYEKNGNKEEAISQFEESIKICPWFAESYDRLGILYLQRLELEKAVEYFKKAIILEPRNKKYLDHLSSIRTGEV
jgi:tetratricopeptide (TPR) repeat protein